jgi:hypothetical protein
MTTTHEIGGAFGISIFSAVPTFRPLTAQQAAMR